MQMSAFDEILFKTWLVDATTAVIIHARLGEIPARVPCRFILLAWMVVLHALSHTLPRWLYFALRTVAFFVGGRAYAHAFGGLA